VFHCKEKISVQISSTFSVKSQTLSACTDWCYEQYVTSGTDYSKCVKRYCTKKTFGLKFDSSSKDGEKCLQCHDITDHDYLEYCLKTNCREEIILKLVKVKPSSFVLGCVDCSDYYENGQFDLYEQCIQTWCKGDLVIAAFEYFGQTGLILGEVQNSCARCEEFREDSSRFSTCLVYNCKESALKRGLYLSKGQTLTKGMTCVDLCTGESALKNENCFSGACHEQFLTVFDLFLEQVNMGKSSKCSDCFSSAAGHLCLITACKEEVSGKQVLFSKNHPVSFSSKCSTCLYFDGASYLSCIKYNCKEELENKAAFVFSENDKHFARSQLIGVKSCKQCGEFYNEKEVNFQYLCIVNKCENIINSKSLLSQSSSKSCQRCEGFSGNAFKNCASFACKEEIFSVFNDFKSKNNIQVSPLVELNECTDSCYYDWYYYGYDFKTCTYEYCRTFKPVAVSSSSSVSLCSCWSDIDAYGYHQQETIYCQSNEPLKVSNLNSSTGKKCYGRCVHEKKNYSCHFHCREDSQIEPLKLSAKSFNKCYDKCLKQYYFTNENYCKTTCNNIMSESLISPIKLTPCTDTCYHNWVYYGDDYIQCIETYCKNFEPLEIFSESEASLTACNKKCSSLYSNSNQYEKCYHDCGMKCVSRCDSMYSDDSINHNNRCVKGCRGARPSDASKSFSETNNGKNSKNLSSNQPHLYLAFTSKIEKISLVSSSSLNSHCKACQQDLNAAGLTDIGFRVCVAFNCKDELLNDIKNQKSIINKNELSSDVFDDGVLERCADAFGVEVEKVDQKMCLRIFKGVDSGYGSQGLGFWVVGVVLLAVFYFACRVSRKIFVRNSPELGYRLI
jgi:hypothetical protein